MSLLDNPHQFHGHFVVDSSRLGAVIALAGTALRLAALDAAASASVLLMEAPYAVGIAYMGPHLRHSGAPKVRSYLQEQYPGHSLFQIRSECH